ncbi:DUF6449 domain-containing protein [Bacillus sp. REN10]|uniref:DUF6449 domain-containing protein n=1 Tax=Bacillus sp. REN10 TaxID=2782541 RepID=UPI00193C4350|nr:DUF6449 domain-containing protein [Bacillus sp. REN10]
MVSAILFFNQGIWRQKAKVLGWLSFLYFLLLFFIVPLQLLVKHTNEEWEFINDLPSVFQLSADTQTMLILTVPVGFAVFAFRYLHVKAAADFMHSLPVSRSTLFYQYTICGFIFMIIPVVSTAVVLTVSQWALGVQYFSASDVLIWIGFTLFWNFVIYAAAVFSSMLTGMSVMQILFTYALFLLPIGFIVLAVYNLKFLLHGFSAEYYLNFNLERFIIFSRIYSGTDITLQWWEWLVYGGGSMLCLFIALAAYKRRPTETATLALAFPKLRPVFVYSCTFLAMLFGGLYFGSIQHTVPWIVFGLLIFSFLSYFIARMIVEKTTRVFVHWKGYLLFMGATLLLALSIHSLDGVYEKKVPDMAKIEEAYFSDGIYGYHQDDLVNTTEIQASNFYKDPVNIKKITEFHQQAIKNKSHQLKNVTPVVFAYKTEQGKKFIREYDISITQYEKWIGELASSEEFKYNQYPLLRIDDTNIENINLYSDIAHNKQLTLTNPKQMKQLIALLKEEMKKEDLTNNTNSWGRIEIYFDNEEMISAPWQKTYPSVEKWLEDEGLLEQIKVMPYDIGYAIVFETAASPDLYGAIDDRGQVKSSIKQIKIKDKGQIEKLLSVAPTGGENNSYAIAYYLKNQDHPTIEQISKKEAPAFIKEQLSK